MSRKLWLSVAFACALIISACSNASDTTTEEQPKEPAENETTNEQTNEQQTATELVNNPPSLEDLDEKDPMTEYIKYGEKVINETNTVMDGYVGNQLSCASCHADGGLSNVSSFVGVSTQFPQYRPREGVIFTLEDRINGCMIRSMNGEKIPYDSKEMRSMIAYLTYISKDIPEGADIPWRMLNKKKELPVPDVANGEELYKKSCIACHGEDGAGTGANSGPALWGENSFNDGAGMSRFMKMAAYVQRNMPVGQENSLSDQQVSDLAAYILQHERPVWGGHETDWPKGGRPTDIMNKERREQVRNGTFDWTEMDIIKAD
ncbi:c-type cytochrome [Bacillus tianshenii]|nr:c-type cytochrome [Bacillus tianshenii]